MNTQTIEEFYVIGISVRTTNENGQAMQDIPALWGKFVAENLIESIPNKVDFSVYCLYTDYQKDHTKPYTTIIGCKVNSLTVIPDGMVAKVIAKGNYTLFSPKGNMQEGLVYNEWMKIWEADLPRTFETDFEVYGEKTQNLADAEVDIYIAV